MKTVTQNRTEAAARWQPTAAMTDTHEPETGLELLEWHALKGQAVEVRHNCRPYRRGWVEDAMPDGSGLWVAAYGPAGRELIWQGEGFSVHALETHPDAGSGGLHYGEDNKTQHAPSLADRHGEPGHSK
jgi:hypothetical protein